MAAEWWYRSNERSPLGPVHAAELAKLVATGVVLAGTLVRKGEASPWVVASEVTGLFDTDISSEGTLPHLSPSERPFTRPPILSPPLSPIEAPPLQNDVDVFVLSNAPIRDWQVEQFMANELFAIKWHKRDDAASNQRRYFQPASELLTSKEYFGNEDVCQKIEMSVRTGQQYWKPYKASLKTPLDHIRGRIQLKVPDSVLRF